MAKPCELEQRSEVRLRILLLQRPCDGFRLFVGRYGHAHPPQHLRSGGRLAPASLCHDRGNTLPNVVEHRFNLGSEGHRTGVTVSHPGLRQPRHHAPLDVFGRIRFVSRTVMVPHDQESAAGAAKIRR